MTKERHELIRRYGGKVDENQTDQQAHDAAMKEYAAKGELPPEMLKIAKKPKKNQVKDT